MFGKCGEELKAAGIERDAELQNLWTSLITAGLRKAIDARYIGKKSHMEVP
jgi:hypothetical protein